MSEGKRDYDQLPAQHPLVVEVERLRIIAGNNALGRKLADERSERLREAVVALDMKPGEEGVQGGDPLSHGQIERLTKLYEVLHPTEEQEPEYAPGAAGIFPRRKRDT